MYKTRRAILAHKQNLQFHYYFILRSRFRSIRLYNICFRAAIYIKVGTDFLRIVTSLCELNQIFLHNDRLRVCTRLYLLRAYTNLDSMKRQVSDIALFLCCLTTFVYTTHTSQHAHIYTHAYIRIIIQRKERSRRDDHTNISDNNII